MLRTAIILLAFAAFLGPETAQADTVNFGTNDSEFARDGECDDRRFFGDGMAADLDRADIGADAKDCKKLYDANMIQLWVQADAQAATRDAKINFGDNSSEWANDGECDDVRFEGPGTADVTATGDVGQDENDCRKMYGLEQIFLRNYK